MSRSKSCRQPPSARKLASASNTATDENGGLPQLAIAFVVNTESIANSWVTLTPAFSSNFGASTNEAFSPSPQLAPVEARVKVFSARAGVANPDSASAIPAAPQPRRELNCRRSIGVVIGPPWSYRVRYRVSAGEFPAARRFLGDRGANRGRFPVPPHQASAAIIAAAFSPIIIVGA